MLRLIYERNAKEGFPIFKKKLLIIYMSLPTASCETERVISALLIIIRKQTSNSHARRKTGLSFYALHRKRYYKIVAI